MGRKPHPGLADESLLRRRYLADGATLAELAAELGVDPRAVARALERHGIPRREGSPPAPPREAWPRPPAGSPARLADPAWLRRRYETDQRSTRQIAAEVGCSAETVRHALAAAKVPLRQPRHDTRLDDAGWLRTELTAKSQRKLAKELGVDSSVVTRAAARLGIDAAPPRAPQLRDPDWLFEQYVTRGRSTTAIGKEIGVSAPTVAAALTAVGIAVHGPGGGRHRPQPHASRGTRRRPRRLG